MTDQNNPPTSEKVVRVLVADDSMTIRYHLVSMINEIPGLHVIGEASDGKEAVDMVARLKPDVVSMDIRMPHMDGLEATRQIMAQCPTPVVVVSGLVDNDIDLSFNAIEAGALAVVAKPPDRNSPLFNRKKRDLARMLTAMSEVSVVRRGYKAPDENGHTTAKLRTRVAKPEIIAIGASAGGPSALSQLLSDLPENLPVPIVIVQHIPEEFVVGLARWLNKVSPLTVKIAVDRAVLEPGVVNLSPGTAHVKIVRHGDDLLVRLTPEQGKYRYQPSIDVLFESVAVACKDRAIGMVMTGMGDDGAVGLLKMRQAGAWTFAQDQASSTVFGMPSAAIDRGAVEKTLSLAEMPSAILKLVPDTG
jgi:two-component system chemotaxis response regulator CheB